jgi:hypothetical protein
MNKSDDSSIENENSRRARGGQLQQNNGVTECGQIPNLFLHDPGSLEVDFTRQRLFFEGWSGRM